VSLILTLASKWGCDTQGGERKDTLVQKSKTNMNGIDRSQVFMAIEYELSVILFSWKGMEWNNI
jgi:hypothetical protein